MWTLNNFYTSKEWEHLRDVVKLERLNESGLLVCDHCGEPIVKKYDCICHHKEELTNANVNNPEISLNPDNIVLVHHKCHNLIHKKGRHIASVSNVKKVYIVYGPPYAGKHKYVESIATDDDLIISMDRIWKCIVKQGKSDRIKSNVFGVRNFLLEQIKMRQGKWSTCYVIGGYPYDMERERLKQNLGAECIYIDTSKADCLSKVRGLENEKELTNHMVGKQISLEIDRSEPHDLVRRLSVENLNIVNKDGDPVVTDFSFESSAGKAPRKITRRKAKPSTLKRMFFFPRLTDAALSESPKLPKNAAAKSSTQKGLMSSRKIFQYSTRVLKNPGTISFMGRRLFEA